MEFQPLIWRVRVLLIIVVSLMVLSGVPDAVAGKGELEALRSRALELVNRDRQDHGLEPLKLEDELNEVAQNHSEDMHARSYYSHESPEGDRVRDRYIAAGGSGSRIVAENIARCEGCPAPPTVQDVERLHRGWMESPQHRENILRRGLSMFGFGIIVADNVQLAAQTFAGPGQPRGLQPGEEPEVLSTEAFSERFVRLLNRARERGGVGAVEASEPLGEAARRLAPVQGVLKGELKQDTGLLDAMSPDQRGRWSSISMLMAACSGCGAEPTAADLRWFGDQWLDNPQHRTNLLDPETTHAGIWIAADGQGAKLAVLLLGGSAGR